MKKLFIVVKFILVAMVTLFLSVVLLNWLVGIVLATIIGAGLAFYVSIFVKPTRNFVFGVKNTDTKNMHKNSNDDNNGRFF